MDRVGKGRQMTPWRMAPKPITWSYQQRCVCAYAHEYKVYTQAHEASIYKYTICSNQTYLAKYNINPQRNNLTCWHITTRWYVEISIAYTSRYRQMHGAAWYKFTVIYKYNRICVNTRCHIHSHKMNKYREINTYIYKHYFVCNITGTYRYAAIYIHSTLYKYILTILIHKRGI